MGNALGNIGALLLVIIAAAISFFSFATGSAIFASAIYAIWLFIWIGDLFTRPPRDTSLALLLSPVELEAYRTYHTFLQFPGAAQALSAFLNLLRLAGIVWGGICLWNGNYWVGGALIAYFFLVGGACLRFDPVRYFIGAAKSGNDVAQHQLVLIERVEKTRAVYNAAKG